MSWLLEPKWKRLPHHFDIFENSLAQTSLTISSPNRVQGNTSIWVIDNEPEAMRQYAIEQGVPDEDGIPAGCFVLDDGGRRTYDTCYRAEYIFGVQNTILVTQWFHLDRALYTCDKLGIDVVGVAADRREYYLARFWWVREVAAVSRAWLDLNFLHPTPVLGDKEPIV
ncbi:MAG: YdcF family protein [Anaerolineae bacterium]|nr:YdcF family protein [Anaerolineae bacterium]